MTGKRTKSRVKSKTRSGTRRRTKTARAAVKRAAPAKAAPQHAALASKASGQRGHSKVRAHSASEDARGRAGDTRPEAGSSARDALDDFIVAAGRALELPIEPAWQGAIKSNLEVTLRLSAAFADFPLPDDAEPAPVFVA